jgi:hypothetical protein
MAKLAAAVAVAVAVLWRWRGSKRRDEKRGNVLLLGHKAADIERGRRES